MNFSNPQVQRETLEYGGLSLLCQLMVSSESEVVQRRGLYAVSALLRGNPQDQQVGLYLLLLLLLLLYGITASALHEITHE